MRFAFWVSAIHAFAPWHVSPGLPQLILCLVRRCYTLSSIHMNTPTANPHFHGLRTVIYHAPDLDKAKAWYSSVLGIAPYFDQPFYVGFSVGGYELALDPDASSTPGGTAGAVTYWGVADAQARSTVLSRSEPPSVQPCRRSATAFELPRSATRSATSLASSRTRISSSPANDRNA